MRSWSRWWARQDAGVVLLPWLVAAATTIWMKVRALSCDAFRESAHAVRHSGMLTGWEKASLFRWDVLLGLVVIPALLVAAGRMLPRTWRALASALFSAGIVAGLMVEEITRCNTGSFQSARVVAEAVVWSMRNHDNSVFYISLLDRIQLVAVLALVVLLGVAAARASEQSLQRINQGVLATIAAGAFATAVLSVPKAPAMVWNTPMLLAVGQAAEGPAAPENQSMMHRTLPELHHRYCELANAPAPEASGWDGRARGYNVIFFVMETMPAEVFDPAHDDLADMPTARRLRQHSLVGAQHFTTLALTSAAVFSMFTSIYPHGPGPVGYTMGRNVELPGAIRLLNAAGYQTGYYGFVWKSMHERDDLLMTSLGFGKVAEPAIDPEMDRDGATTFHGPIEYAAKHDGEVLSELLKDIHRWTGSRQKFAAAFFPEVGHDPWRDPPGVKSNSAMERGHALAVYQDAWLGQIVDELERDGALQNTIIVVTGDHGLRLVTDRLQGSSQVVAGKYADYMIRVPLLMYVPGVLEEPKRVEWATSHIDIAPTVLDLLGIGGERKWEQGTDLWNPQLQQRRVFLVLDLFGVSGGYSEGGTYYLRTGTGTVFKNSRVRFEDNDALLQDDGETLRVRNVLSEAGDVQQAFLYHVLRGESGAGDKEACHHGNCSK